MRANGQTFMVQDAYVYPSISANFSLYTTIFCPYIKASLPYRRRFFNWIGQSVSKLTDPVTRRRTSDLLSDLLAVKVFFPHQLKNRDQLLNEPDSDCRSGNGLIDEHFSFFTVIFLNPSPTQPQSCQPIGQH